MNENYKKAKRLIKEGQSNVQDKLIEIMMDIKRDNFELTHSEVMDIFQSEIDKFIKHHKTDRAELPSQRILKDRMPIMKIPYGGKKKFD